MALRAAAIFLALSHVAARDWHMYWSFYIETDDPPTLVTLDRVNDTEIGPPPVSPGAGRSVLKKRMTRVRGPDH